jgi:hypothetical protein
MSERNWRWIWQPDLGEGVEQFKFPLEPCRADERGDIAATLGGAAFDAGYLVEADAAWHTQRVRIGMKG